jgi:hypothetical protein
MLNPVATHFVLILSTDTTCGMLRRSDRRKSAKTSEGSLRAGAADRYRVLT